MLLIISIICDFSIIIGANEKDLRLLPMSIFLGLIILYLIIYKIKNKKKCNH